MTKKTTTLEFFVLPLARSPPSDTYPVSVLGHPGELYPILKATPILTQSANLQPMTASNQQAAATPIDDYSSSPFLLVAKKQIHISKNKFE